MPRLVLVCEKMRVEKSLLLVCILCGALCILSSCIKAGPGGARVAKMVGDHPVEIIATTNADIDDELYDLPDGTRAYKFQSGRLKITLEHEVLTVNGERYIIPKKDDSIQIEDTRVKINGRLAKPAH
jgi:hypothetical protein